jgi:hypothetical protein
VGHRGHDTGVLDGGHDPAALLLRGRERLLDEQGVSEPGERDGRLRMVAVERRDDGRVGQPRHGRRLPPIAEAALGQDAVLRCEPLAVLVAGLGHRDHAGAVGVVRRPAGEHRAARAGAHDEQLDGRHQNADSACSICRWPFLSASSGDVFPPSAALTFL